MRSHFDRNESWSGVYSQRFLQFFLDFDIEFFLLDTRYFYFSRNTEIPLV